jgi:hypothetical protein
MAQSEKKSWLGWLSLALLLLGLLTAYVAFRRYLERKKADQTPSLPDDDQEETGVYDPKRFFEVLDDTLGDTVDDTTKRIITAQAMHESGVFTSLVFQENNNPFGMKQPEKRDTLAIGENRGYAVYETVKDSINDLVLWFEYNAIPLNFQSPSAYAAKIREYGYYESPYADYTSALKAHLRNLDKSLKRNLDKEPLK